MSEHKHVWTTFGKYRVRCIGCMEFPTADPTPAGPQPTDTGAGCQHEGPHEWQRDTLVPTGGPWCKVGEPVGRIHLATAEYITALEQQVAGEQGRANLACKMWENANQERDSNAVQLAAMQTLSINYRRAIRKLGKLLKMTRYFENRTTAVLIAQTQRRIQSEQQAQTAQATAELLAWSLEHVLNAVVNGDNTWQSQEWVDKTRELVDSTGAAVTEAVARREREQGLLRRCLKYVEIQRSEKEAERLYWQVREELDAQQSNNSTD